MKDGKAIGEDGVAVEMIEALGGGGCEVMAQQANKIYDTGQTPTQISCLPSLPYKRSREQWSVINIER